MSIKRVWAFASLLIISVFVITACGQRGDLYLPDNVDRDPAILEKKRNNSERSTFVLVPSSRPVQDDDSRAKAKRAE